MINLFEGHLNDLQLGILASLTNPCEIQSYLDQTPYSTEDRNRTPVEVMQDGVAHCLDGALFAAAALRRISCPALLIDMFPERGMDDDHVLAIFQANGHYGALAKSNFAGLRMREPIFRSIRELVMSYFEWFYNVDGVKTLRTYTRMLNLKQFDGLGWIWNPEGVQAIERRLLSMPRIPLITPHMASQLNLQDSLTYKAGMLGVNPAGLYRPGKTNH